MNDNAIKAKGDMTTKGDMTLWWGECLKLSEDTWRAGMRQAQQRVY